MSSILLSFEGGNSVHLLFICAGILGFAISWQYGSAFSWSAQYIDVVGPNASLFTIGCTMSFFVPISGAYLFKRWTPMALWHFNLVLVSLQLCAFLAFPCVFDRKRNQHSVVVEYQEVNQMEEINLSTSEDEE